MILGLIFSVLSVTYSVASSNSLNMSGVAPEGSQASYVRSSTTGKKGQMTSGNSTTLTLCGWEGCCIERVVLSMCSNTAQGAGSLRMQVGNRNVWVIEDADFAAVAWHGSYSATFVDICHDMQETIRSGEDIKLHIEASKNSLYIDSYTIYYSQLPPEPHTVGFVSGLGESPAPLLEDSIGAGVVLPQWVDTLQWRFVGWSERDVMEGDSCPKLWLPNERYYPKSDGTLWAVYSDSEACWSIADYVTGDYVVASADWGVALVGAIEHGEVGTIPIALSDCVDGDCALQTPMKDEMVYRVTIMADSMLTIQHVQTGEMIGYSGTQLSPAEVRWRYRVVDDGTLCVYCEDKKVHRMLCVGYGSDGTGEHVVAYAIRANLGTMRKNGLSLYPAVKQHYTSWPFGKLYGVEDNMLYDRNIEGNYEMYFGSYVLRIQDGKKTLMRY